MIYLLSHSTRSGCWCHLRQCLLLGLFALASPTALSQLSTQPADTGDAINVHPKTPLNTARLWLPAQHVASAGSLLAAAHRALEHPDCAEVLYGGLNEFRTEREGTSFTIMCIKDARTTFNQIFFQSDLPSASAPFAAAPVAADPFAAAPVAPVDESAAREELDRLRNLLGGPSGPPPSPAPVEQQQPPVDTGPPPTVF